MQKAEVRDKFGDDFMVNEDTFIMGVHHLFADHIASRFRDYKIVLDACCGAGFMAIALARIVDKVISFDINSEHLSQAQTNAKVAGVAGKVYFIHADISDKNSFRLFEEIDGAFLDPDWAKPGDEKIKHTSRFSEMQPSANVLMELALQKTQNIALRLPKEIDEQELSKYQMYEMEEFVMDGKRKFFVAYFGKLAKSKGRTKFEVSKHYT